MTYHLFNSNPVKSNGDWGSICFDVDYLDIGTGNNILNVRCTFTKGGQDLILNGSNGDEFGFYLTDDFSSLVHHSFHLQGLIKSEVIY